MIVDLTKSGMDKHVAFCWRRSSFTLNVEGISEISIPALHITPPPSSFLLCTSRNRKRGVVLRQSLILPRFISQPLLAGLKHQRKVSGIPVMNGTLVSSSVWELFRANGWESGTRLQFFFLLLLLSFSFLFFFCVVLFCFWRKGFSAYLGPS